MLDGLYYASKVEDQGVDLKKDSSGLIRLKFIPTTYKGTAADWAASLLYWAPLI